MFELNTQPPIILSQYPTTMKLMIDYFCFRGGNRGGYNKGKSTENDLFFDKKALTVPFLILVLLIKLFCNCYWKNCLKKFIICSMFTWNLFSFDYKQLFQYMYWNSSGFNSQIFEFLFKNFDFWTTLNANYMRGF